MLNYTTTIHENLAQVFDQNGVNEGVLHVVRLNLERLQEMMRRDTADESIVVSILSLSFYMVSQQPWSNSPTVEQQNAFRNLYDLLVNWAFAAEELLVNTQITKRWGCGVTTRNERRVNYGWLLLSTLAR